MNQKTKNLILRIVLVIAFLLISMLISKLASKDQPAEQPVESTIQLVESSEVTVASSETPESTEAIVSSVEESIEESIAEASVESTEESIVESETAPSESITSGSTDFDEDDEDAHKPSSDDQNDPDGPTGQLDPYGSYYSKDQVAEYLYTYGELPDNFITKSEAEALGWSGGKVEPYAPGMVIGGDKFGNREKILPTKKGRQYYECDIDTLNKKRGTKRIVFSNDGLIYYTDDHYETFTLLYGEE